MKVHYRMFSHKLPDHKQRQSADRQNSQSSDETRGEPIVFLSLIEHDLQGAEPDCQQPNAPAIYLCRFTLDVPRIEDKQVRHHDREVATDPHHVNTPTPPPPLGHPSTPHSTHHP